MNPVPSSLSFKFSDEKDKREFSFDKKYLTYEAIEKLLRFFYFTDYEMYILISLLAYTGARISEICTIQLRDINLKDRIIISGRIPDFSKTGLVIYFYPAFFQSEFSEFVRKRRQTQDIFLFKSRARSQKEFMHPKT
ncbi:MAG: tyrosine-type recombinase/integrase, partial [Promethearchaeota archaeon]